MSAVSKPPKLVWDDLDTVDGAWRLQKERPLHEGTLTYVMSGPDGWKKVRDDLNLDTCKWGPGCLAATRKAVRLIHEEMWRRTQEVKAS